MPEADGVLGPWEPMEPDEAATEFSGWGVPWWVAGGWAIDLLLGRRTRPHDDLDVLVLRRHHEVVRAHLEVWDVWAADPPGVLRPWPVGETLPVEVRDVWCRRRPDAPWAFQLMIDEADDDGWSFAGDRRIRRSIESLTGRASTAGRSVLTVEVQLLHKSASLRDKDRADFQAVRDHLTMGERDWLRAALEVTAPGHCWLPDL